MRSQLYCVEWPAARGGEGSLCTQTSQKEGSTGKPPTVLIYVKLIKFFQISTIKNSTSLYISKNITLT